MLTRTFNDDGLACTLATVGPVCTFVKAMLTFDGAEDGIEKTHEYAQQVDFLRQYKDAMVESWNMLATEQDLANGRQPTFTTPAALEALLKILYMPMIAEERTNKDSDMIE